MPEKTNKAAMNHNSTGTYTYNGSTKNDPSSLKAKGLPPGLMRGYESLYNFYAFLFYVEMFVLFLWLGLTIWAIVTDLEATVELRFGTVHFLAPAAIFYVFAEIKKKISSIKDSGGRGGSSNPRLSAGNIKVSMYVVFTVFLVDVTAFIIVLRIIHLREDGESRALIYMISILIGFFSLLSLLHLYWLFCANSFVKKTRKAITSKV